MKIKDLEEKGKFGSIRARILSKQGPRRVRTKKGMSYVTDILIADDTGTTVLNLWGSQKAHAMKIGQVIEIKDGECKLYNYQKQISLGSAGRVAIIADDPTLPRTIPQ